MEGAVHSHRDFRVRRSVVHRALNWLVTHNQYYRSNHVYIDVNALEQLPHDGNLSQLTSITVESANTEPPATNTPATGPPVADTPETSEDPYSAHLPQSFVPIATRIYDRAGGSASVCSGATIKPIHVINACHHDVASIGGLPINEFTTEGYFSCAFPTLFPTGAGDFSGQRQNQVTIGNYFKHLTMYDDNRFAKHPRFRFFALNTEMRWHALQTGRVYVKQHPGVCEGQTFSNRVHSIREYQNSPNSYLLFTKVSMHLSISHSLCSAVHNYDSLCWRSSRSPIMLCILLVGRAGASPPSRTAAIIFLYIYIFIYIRSYVVP